MFAQRKTINIVIDAHGNPKFLLQNFLQGHTFPCGNICDIKNNTISYINNGRYTDADPFHLVGHRNVRIGLQSRSPVWVFVEGELAPKDRPRRTSFSLLAQPLQSGKVYLSAVPAGDYVLDLKVQWADPAEKGTTDKATLLPKLKEALDKCNAVYASDSSQIGPLLENMGHTNLHYGNLITYIRMMGMKPPSS